VTVTALGEDGSKELRILVVEDLEDDFRLLVREVQRAGYHVIAKQVDTEAALIAALADSWDVVVADYTLPLLSAETALAVVRERLPEMPVIIASGSVGEERAVAVLKAGANDFVLKGATARLVPAIEREVREARIRGERTRLREQLVMSDRLASVGTLAAGIAHEINNPLAVAMGNVEYALTSVIALERGVATAIGPEVREPLADARDALARVRDIVRDVKLFSRAGDPAKRGPIDVRQVLRSALRMTWNEARHRARLVEELGPVPVIEANDSRIAQAVLNVLVNAIQALPEGRAAHHRLTVRTATDERGWAVLDIEDTGCGIPAEHLPRVFEPFYTTKPADEATGVGLTISAAIIAESGGTIDVKSEVGVGTQVRIALPPGTEVPREKASTPPPTGIRRRILVIDDEPGFGAVIKRTLGDDHEIVIATSSRDGLARMQEAAPDLILCDLMMPDIDGISLYRMLDPSTQGKMVFVTAGAFSASGRAFLDGVPNRRLDKPFDPEALRALVRELAP
jgi:signal transduction histidine kinase